MISSRRHFINAMFKLTTGPAPTWRIRTLFAVLFLLVAFIVIECVRFTWMPLRSYAGALPPLTAEESNLRDRLAADVKDLSVTLGERSLRHPQSLAAAADDLTDRLEAMGYTVKRIRSGNPILPFAFALC